MSAVESMAVSSGRLLKENDSYINSADAFKQIKANVVSHVTMDSFRAAVIDGNAYKMGFADVTGIPAATSYYYWVKNTSTTKNIWLRPLSFNTGTLLLRIVKSTGIFQVGGVTYDPNDYIDMEYTGTLTESAYTISGTFDTAMIKVGMYISGVGIPARTVIAAVTSSQITMSNAATASGEDATLIISTPNMISRNLNTNYLSQESALKIWYQGVLGTITYADTAIDQLYNVTDYLMQEPDKTETANEMNILAPGTEFMVILSNYGTTKIPYSLTAKWAEV